MTTKEFLSQLGEQKIVDAIANAESKTSGEIRVFVSDRPVDDPVAEAERQFVRLGMEQTRARNGVLIFFAPVSQGFAIVGDRGIHQVCGSSFWDEIAAMMTDLLKKACFTEAVLAAVERVGAALAQHFPREPGDQNELTNEIARG